MVIKKQQAKRFTFSEMPNLIQSMLSFRTLNVTVKIHIFYIGLLNEVRWQDSRIMIDIIAPSYEDGLQLETASTEFSEILPRPSTEKSIRPEPLGVHETDILAGANHQVKHSIELKEEEPTLDLIVQAIFSLRNSRSWKPQWHYLCRAFVLHHLLLRDVAVANRRISKLAQEKDKTRYSLAEAFLI